MISTEKTAAVGKGEDRFESYAEREPYTQCLLEREGRKRRRTEANSGFLIYARA